MGRAGARRTARAAPSGCSTRRAALVGTATSFPSQTAVPGGAVLPLGAVTRVGVRADHTRRGLLTALMRRPARRRCGPRRGARGCCGPPRRGSTAGSATASPPARGPSGSGARGRRCGPAAPVGRQVRLLDRDEIVPVLAARARARIALRRPGGITRTAGWWRRSAWPAATSDPLLAAVHTGQDGDDGFALAVPHGDFGDPLGGTLRVEDLHAADTAAAAGLWRFLLGVDLIGYVEAAVALDDPLDLLLDDPRHALVTGLADETWLRLVDVPAALAARSFAAGAGPVCWPSTTPAPGQHRGLPDRRGGGRAGRAARRACDPELSCDVAALAMAYLGDRSPSALAGTGWWTVHDPAALARADARSPPTWCRGAARMF